MHFLNALFSGYLIRLRSEMLHSFGFRRDYESPINGPLLVDTPHTLVDVTLRRHSVFEKFMRFERHQVLRGPNAAEYGVLKNISSRYLA